MRKYPKYKDSGVDWLTDIPSGWDVIALKHLVKIKVTDGPHETPVAVEEGIPFVSAEAVQNHTINFDSKWGFISKEDHLKYSKKCKPINGDIFIVKSGATTGKIAYVNTDIEFNIWSPLALVRANEKSIISRYLFNYIVSPLFQEQVQFSWSFGTQQNIGMGVIQNLLIVTPPLPEQYDIVRFLDFKTKQIDSFIANRKKQIELLKEQKAAIINKAVTKGINPNAKMKNSGIEWIGQVPEHWTVSKLKFVASIFGRIGFRGYTINDLVEKGEGAITISPSNMKADQMDFSSCTYISWFKHEESPEIKIFNGDILFVKTGSTYGKISLVENLNEPATINPQILVFKKIKTNTLFFYHQLRSKLIQAHVKTSVIGGTIPTISQEKIGNYYFLLPSNEEQEKIMEHIRIETKIIDELVSKYHKQIDLMQEYRISLISQAVTGKIDVRKWEPKAKEKVV